MMHIVRMGALAALTTVSLSFLAAQETVKEPSTGKTFPSQITMTYEGTSHTLTLTGTAVRKKFVFKVYGMAHFAEDPQPGSFKSVIAGILKDGKAKQITMEFVRDVEVDKILSAYRDGFAENATAEEQKAIAPSLKTFLTYFTKDVKENDRFVLQWLPGGIILAETQGVTHPAITDATFARILWTIWLGEDSIVDPEDLVSLLVR
jgi:hypothetical protein